MPQQRLGRSWGTRFDSLTSSDSLPSNPESVAARSRHMSSSPRSVSVDDGNSVQDTHDRIIQDASIFIGSLPANIEHPELASMLSQHLAEHPQVKGIKVVRDSKGGTCAFIQCQDPEAASMLMNNLHSIPPQPFLGRYLRYEPARAFKTLLISYRSPRQYVRQRDTLRKINSLTNEDSRFVDVELPNAMKIFKTPGSKQFSILYDAEASDATPTSGADSDLSLVPLLYDAESLFRIASVFGVIDYFGPYSPENECGQMSANFPPPHDVPRSPVMDPGCWKVKWVNRDDCVSALVTLRRIPHLTVTWAHQSNTPHGPYNIPRAFPGIQPSHSWRGRVARPSARSASCFLPASRTFPALHATTEDSSQAEHLSDDQVAYRSPKCNVWQQGSSSTSNGRSTHYSRPSRPRALSLTHDRPQPAVSLPSRESTGQLSFTNWESTNRYRWADQVEPTEFKGPSITGPNFTSSPYLSHHMASSDSGCHTSQEGDGQEINASIPHTPDFGASPVTPRTPGSLMLRTPTTASYMGDFQSMSFRDYDSQGSLQQFSQEKRDDHIVDPTTIFIGGLEMYGPNAWDESKVKALFSKYGGIEGVKFIRPNNKRSAFAFVKFSDTEAPIRAIKGEHNRMLDGRLIRVQLRDWNPAYRSWRSGPNREFSSQQFGAIDHCSVDPKLPRPGIVSIAAHIANLQLTGSPTQLTSQSVDQACDLNEVRDETRIPPLQPSPAGDSEQDSAKEACKTEKSMDTGQGDPSISDMTAVFSQTSVVAPTLPGPYSGPTLQFYHGWIPNYAPQFPYQVPFAGQPYPGYPLPPPIVPPPGGSDGSGNPGPNATVPIGPASGPFPAFLPYPPSLGSDSGQVPAGHPGLASNPTIIHTQAPLIPTGFIHGDQGMLVPVYPPDALNQYMAGNQDQGQAPANTGSAERQPPMTWRPYAPPPIRPAVILQPYINPPLGAPHHLGAPQWVPGHLWHGVAAPSGNSHGGPGRRITSSSAGGPLPAPMCPGFERNSVPPRRQYRRDNHSQYHKNHFTRGPVGRVGKPPFDASRSPSDIQSTSVPHTAVPDTSVDANWQCWNTNQGKPV